MNIENGDLFVITRGFRLGPRMDVFALFSGESWQPKREEEPEYDRSYEGNVYRAEQVCGPVIAARLVFCPERKSRYSEKTKSFNTNEVEVWPVTPQYLAALQDNPIDTPDRTPAAGQKPLFQERT